MRTFDAEDALARVPLPTLAESCARFLDWCAPLLTPDELARTRAAVAAFVAPGGAGERLHAELVRYDALPGVQSWLDTFWADRYLGRRDRIALNANFFFLFEDSRLGQVDRAAALVEQVLGYKARIDDETLPPARHGGEPLSMVQHRHLFSSTRIPGVDRDRARTPYSDAHPGPSRARHVVVLLRGNVFRLDVIGSDGRPRTRAEIAAGLRAVQAAAGPGDGVGALTAMARADWARAREALRDHDPANAAALEIVESALFCVCLQDEVPESPLAACDALLAGNSADRWFDTAVSLIVFGDGTAGYNGEHCNLDGTTVIALLDEVLAGSAALAPAPVADTVPEFAAVPWVLDDRLRATVTDAAKAFADHAAATATTTVRIDFGSDRAKALGISPDAFAQLAFQVAHHRATGRVGATYESIATRHFRHGRTEAMRVVTPEIVAFTAAMADPAVPAVARRDALTAAADAHVRRVRECRAGRAPEQHLWELQMIATRRGEPAPALFDSPGWRILRDDRLSTSSVPSPHVRFWGFGSTGAQCIGVGYALMPSRFDLYLSTPRAVAATMAAFAAELPRAVAQMESLLADEGDDRG
ncbi:choline/carnitine O-acyltransferase [Pseudonocardia benzenivorans]|uniref:Choline/carnitine O-acyltransferase n=1 Tax=Pseudonocardia benzenivorans TaxID=228005 RepID=A0ABW3VQ40_9PSEU